MKTKAKNFEKFNAELLECGGCQGLFRVFITHSYSNKLCLLDAKFFHCHIAGACVGPNCSVIMSGGKYSLKYCLSCVNPYLKVNIEDNGMCLCKTCENHPDIPNYYKQV